MSKSYHNLAFSQLVASGISAILVNSASSMAASLQKFGQDASQHVVSAFDDLLKNASRTNLDLQNITAYVESSLTRSLRGLNENSTKTDEENSENYSWIAAVIVASAALAAAIYLARRYNLLDRVMTMWQQHRAEVAAENRAAQTQEPARVQNPLFINSLTSDNSIMEPNPAYHPSQTAPDRTSRLQDYFRFCDLAIEQKIITASQMNTDKSGLIEEKLHLISALEKIGIAINLNNYITAGLALIDEATSMQENITQENITKYDQQFTSGMFANQENFLQAISNYNDSFAPEQFSDSENEEASTAEFFGYYYITDASNQKLEPFKNVDEVAPETNLQNLEIVDNFLQQVLEIRKNQQKKFQNNYDRYKTARFAAKTRTLDFHMPQETATDDDFRDLLAAIANDEAPAELPPTATIAGQTTQLQQNSKGANFALD